MDFLDPKKQRKNKIMLIVGYLAVTVAALLGAYLLLLIAQGYGHEKNGKVFQNGLAFFSSHPSGAQIYMNNVVVGTTGARLEIPSGIYNFSLAKTGYRSWDQTVKVEGGMVVRYDFPILFPIQLTTTVVQSITTAPLLTTQSPDRHWLLTVLPGSLDNFYEYDLSSPQNAVLAPVTLSLPTGLLSDSVGSESLSVIAWSADSNYLLLKHTYNAGAAIEYILFDRATPSGSVNLTKNFALSASDAFSLQDDTYNLYYIYNSATQSLSEATLGQAGTTLLLTHVLSFSTSGSDSVLYVTTLNSKNNEAELLQGGQKFPIHSIPLSSSYLLAIAQYNGDWYAAIGSSSSSNIDIYEDPAIQYNSTNNHVETALAGLYINNPTSLSFSPSAQFVMAENGSTFSVYDVGNNLGYNFKLAQSLDSPQAAATWMDGSHLEYISKGQLTVFDYSGSNLQILMPASPLYVPNFDSNFNNVYTLEPPASDPSQMVLTLTPLIVS